MFSSTPIPPDGTSTGFRRSCGTGFGSYRSVKAPKIDDLRSPRGTGRPKPGGSGGSAVVAEKNQDRRSLLTVREADDPEAGACLRRCGRDCSGRCPERRFGGVRGGWLTTGSGREPAYPPWPHSVCSPEGLAGGCAPSDPQLQTSRRERREVGQSIGLSMAPKGFSRD